MFVRAHAFSVQRGIAEHVIVELDVRAGLPTFSVIGLAGSAARDARERVQAAVLNCGLAVPRRRVTVNLAPASGRRTGSEFDLAIACCVVAADGRIDPASLARIGLFGELGLGGLLRSCASARTAAAAAGEAGLERLIVSRADLAEARAAGALPVTGMRGLGEVVALLGERSAPRSAQRRDAPGQAGPEAASRDGVARVRAGAVVRAGRASEQDARAHRETGARRRSEEGGQGDGGRDAGGDGGERSHCAAAPPGRPP